MWFFCQSRVASSHTCTRLFSAECLMMTVFWSLAFSVYIIPYSYVLCPLKFSYHSIPKLSSTISYMSSTQRTSQTFLGFPLSALGEEISKLETLSALSLSSFRDYLLFSHSSEITILHYLMCSIYKIIVSYIFDWSSQKVNPFPIIHLDKKQISV